MKSSEYPLPEGWRSTLARVNAEVNAFPYKSDSERYGKAEFWEGIDENGGDCDDYAITKLRRLHAAGFPIQRLRLATCWMGADGGRSAGTGHAVLVLDAPHEQYVLSNGCDVMGYAAFVATGWKRDRIQVIGGSQEWVEWKV